MSFVSSGLLSALSRPCVKMTKMSVGSFAVPRAHVARAQSSSLSMTRNRLFSTSSTPPYGIVFDIDGVLLRGRTVIPGAKDTLLQLRDKNIPFVMLTNGGGRTEASKAGQLTRLLETEIEPSQVILSHTPMQDDLMAKYENKTVLAVGAGKGTSQVLTAYGFKHIISMDDYARRNPTMWPFKRYEAVTDASELKPVPSIDAVIVVCDPEDWGQDLQILCDILRTGGDPAHFAVSHTTTAPKPSQVPIYFSNPDFLWSAENPLPRFGQGAFRVCLEALYERLAGQPLTCGQYGKPLGVTFSYAEVALRRYAESIGAKTPEILFMIGDNPAADVRGANLAGPHWRSILVQSGCAAHTFGEADWSIHDVDVHHDHGFDDVDAPWATVNDAREAISVAHDFVTNQGR